MTRPMRYATVGLMMAGLASIPRLGWAGDFAAEDNPHVRSSNTFIVELLKLATVQSKTFQGLIETLGASDGIVYVEKGSCSRGVQACLVSVVAGGGHRFVQIHVSLGRPDWDVIASIGHELRHSIEVLSTPSVTTTAALFYFYQHAGATGGFLRPFETNAAVDAGSAIRSEVRQHRTSHSPKLE